MPFFGAIQWKERGKEPVQKYPFPNSFVIVYILQPRCERLRPPAHPQGLSEVSGEQFLVVAKGCFLQDLGGREAAAVHSWLEEAEQPPPFIPHGEGKWFGTASSTLWGLLPSLAQELSSPEQTAALQSSTKSIEWVVPRVQGGSQLSALFKVRAREDVGWHQPLLSAVPPRVTVPSAKSLFLSSSPLQLEVPGLSQAVLQELGPVTLSFEVPAYTCSGLQIRFLRFTGPQPHLPYRWVRYVTHSDSYVIRLNTG